MSEMVDRVARALCQSAGHHPDHLVIPHLLPIGPKGLPMMGAAPVAAWMVFVNDAHAAIEAMREPTEAMRRAGFTAEDDEHTGAPLIWRDMIDAALKETK